MIGIVLFQCLYDKPIVKQERIDSKDAMVTGYVDRMEEKENTQAIHLKRVNVRYQDERYKDEAVNRILLYCSKDLSFRIGNQIEAAGSLSEFQSPTNPGQFDEESYYKSKNYSYKMFADSILVTNTSYSRIREFLRSLKMKWKQVYHAILEEKEAGIVTAMVLGDKLELDVEVRELYGRNGIAHILAISGLHVSLVSMLVFWLLMSARCNLAVSSAITILFLCAYGEMTGYSLSTSRAVIMLALSLLANILGRTYDSQTALSTGGCVLLGTYPLSLFQSGFLLSYGAVAGILFVFPILEPLNPFLAASKGDAAKNAVIRFLNRIFAGFLTSLSVSIMTFPVLCYFFYEIPVYSILLNLVVIPCMGMIVILSLLGGMVGFVSLLWGRFLIGAVPFLLGLYEKMCVWAMKLPMHTITTGKPKPYQIFMYYAILFILCLLWRQTEERSKWKPYLKKKEPIRTTRLLCLLGCLLLPCLLLLPSGTKGVLEVTMLDVGQGDGIFIRMPEGTTIFIDGGSSDTKGLGRYRLEPFLKSQGVNHIHYVVVTHADADHTSGMVEMMERMEVNGIQMDALILANTNLVDKEYEALQNMAVKRGMELIRMETGMVLSEKEAYLKCLHPGQGFVAASRNDSSIVCRLTYREFDLLLTGDVEDKGESVFIGLHGHPKNGYEALKVAHHGSRNSTSGRFLEICKPTVSLISCGWKNRYGHPHDELLERLKDCGSLGVSTMDHGAVTIRTDGNRIRMESYVNGKLGEWDCKTDS